MFGATHIYEIHRHPTLAEEDATQLVRQGFSVWAFLLHLAWLFYNRLWLEGILFTVIYIGIIMLAQNYGMSEMVIGILQMTLQFWLALNAADIKAAALERKGYQLVDVSSGESEIEAERRYYYTHAAHL